MKLSIKTSGKAGSLTHLILLVTDNTEVENVDSENAVKIYSDSRFTYIGSVSTPALDVNTLNMLELGNFTYKSIDISITGPRFFNFSRAVLSKGKIFLKNTDEVLFAGAKIGNVKLMESHVRKINIQEDSVVDLELSVCKAVPLDMSRDPTIEVYCSDTDITISENAKLHVSYTREMLHGDLENGWEVWNDTEVQHVFSNKKISMGSILSPLEGVKCINTYKCFGDEPNLAIRRAVGFNDIMKLKTLFGQVTSSDYLLIEAAKTNAIFSARYLHSHGYNRVSERDSLDEIPRDWTRLYENDG